MRELRIHGRGGQGAVIASKLLASALFLEGRSVQSFPAFGVERRGAPVTAFLRFSEQTILLRCEISAPDDLIVLDPTLIHATDVTAGLKDGGSILINSDLPPSGYPELVKRFRVGTVDAAAIAQRHRLPRRKAEDELSEIAERMRARIFLRRRLLDFVDELGNARERGGFGA